MLWWTLRKLRSGDIAGRADAIRTLGRSTHSKATDLLLSELENGGWETEAEVVEALSHRKDPRSVGPLVRLLDGRSGGSAMKILGAIGTPDAIRPLVEMLAYDSIDRFKAIDALSNVGLPAAPALIAVARNPQAATGTRAAAAQLLGGIPLEESRAALVELLSDSHGYVVQSACEGLAALGWSPTTADQRVLFAAVRSHWDQVVSLGASAVPALTSLLAKSGGGVELHAGAAEALGRIGDRSAVPALTSLILSPETHPEIRSAAAIALKGMTEDEADPRVRVELAIAANDWDELVELRSAALPRLLQVAWDHPQRAAALDAIRWIADPRAIDPLKLLVTKSDTEGIAELITLIRDLGGEEEAKALVADLLLQVRSAETTDRAATALGELEEQSAVGALSDVIADRGGDVYYAELRIACAWALSKIGGSQAAASLRDAAKLDEKPYVRTAAQNALASMRASSTGSSTTPPNSTFASQLVCQHCHTRHSTSEWPEDGDVVPFYFQKDPGNFSLRVTCPSCSLKWHVVWDLFPGEVRPLLRP